MTKIEVKIQKQEKSLLVDTPRCEDPNCPFHGNLKLRGRIFKGKVIRKFHKRAVIELERMIYNRKYERYSKSRTKLHARIPECIDESINLGDYIKIQECRPLSKIVHFVVIDKLKEAEEDLEKIKPKRKSQTKTKKKKKKK